MKQEFSLNSKIFVGLYYRAWTKYSHVSMSLDKYQSRADIYIFSFTEVLYDKLRTHLN